MYVLQHVHLRKIPEGVGDLISIRKEVNTHPILLIFTQLENVEIIKICCMEVALVQCEMFHKVPMIMIQFNKK